jgi:hypothetical protein
LYLLNGFFTDDISLYLILATESTITGNIALFGAARISSL